MNKYDKAIWLQSIKHNSTLRAGRFTVVELVSEDNTHAYGVSRRSNEDRDNPGLGEAIAKGRALRALVTKKKGREPQHVFCG